jgi:hypothetical protein
MADNDNNEQKVFNQDLEQNPVPAGAVFIIHLLMEEPCEMPDKDFMVSVLNKHLGDVDCFSCDDTSAGFMAKRYNVHYEEENKNMPPMLMLTKACEIEKPVMNEMDISQTWNCPEAEEILASCKYQVFANDMMAAGLHYLERAEMLTDYVDALLEIYPTCKAVVFETSKKMYTRDELVNCNVAKEDKFIYYAVNVRFFNIQGTDDMIVDTVGMGTLFMPDLQYHFHGMDPNWVVNHAYNVLSYMFARENPIKSGDHIDGVKDGRMCRDVQWNVRYEGALIQPLREVIDFNMNEFASGTRQ